MELGLEKISDERIKSVRSDKIEITNRDYEIVDFLLDMKFAGADEIFNKFFKKTISGGEAKDNRWTKKRMLQLERAKLVRSVKSFSESTKFYLATFKGYYAVANNSPERIVVKPMIVLDHRTFYHDRLVLQSRLALEESQKITSWISDRKLRSIPELAGGLSSNYVPDGIYILSGGERIAFEAEIAVKAKARYREKIQRYLQIMRSREDHRKIFDRVHYICAKKSVIDFLRSETKVYGELFKIESIDEFKEQVRLSGVQTATSAYQFIKL